MNGRFKAAITYPPANDKSDKSSTAGDANKNANPVFQRPVVPRTSSRFETALPCGT